MAQGLQSRVESYRQAWSSKSGNLDGVLDHLADDGLDFSDYNFGMLHLNKDGVRGMLAFLQSAGSDIEMQTRSLSGTVDKAVWEVDFDITVSQDIPGVPYKKGERAKTMGVSLLEWNKEGKLVKVSDYFCWVKPEEK